MNNVFINLTNHPSSLWSESQLQAAAMYGELIDKPFPQVNPEWDEEQIHVLAESTVKSVIDSYGSDRVVVHLMGEQTLCFAMIQLFQNEGITCIASTSERLVTEIEPGKKVTEFRFVRFREYKLFKR